MSIALIFSLFFLLGCNAALDTVIDQWPAEEKPKVSISNPKLTKESVRFELIATNPTRQKLCFDGNSDFPIGLSLKNATTGSTLLWIDGPLIPNGGEAIQEQFVLDPGSAQSFVVSVSRPISGPYYVPNSSVFHKPGELLVGVAIGSFYDCSFVARKDAIANGKAIIVESEPSLPFKG